jgi:hypothetical protein
MSRVKCPNCGSTAQVQYMGESASSGCYDTFERDYVCGCGCEFVVEFSAINVIKTK